MSTVVHECGHSYDLGQGGFGGAHYYLTSQTSFTCSQGDTTSRGGKTFARSRMNSDMFGPSRPKCNGSNTPGCDFYADVYLDGDPDDGTFDGGDQGFNSVLEEATQYVNSLATGYAFRDRYSSQISERDGLLTFLWYIGRYLHMARTQYPDADLVAIKQSPAQGANADAQLEDYEAIKKAYQTLNSSRNSMEQQLAC